MHFDEAHHFDQKHLVPDGFANDELLADPSDIMDTSTDTDESISESHTSILVPVGDEEATPDEQLRRETEAWSRLQFNRGDERSNIQPRDVVPKRFHKEPLTNSTFDP